RALSGVLEGPRPTRATAAWLFADNANRLLDRGADDGDAGGRVALSRAQPLRISVDRRGDPLADSVYRGLLPRALSPRRHRRAKRWEGVRRTAEPAPVCRGSCRRGVVGYSLRIAGCRRRRLAGDRDHVRGDRPPGSTLDWSVLV